MLDATVMDLRYASRLLRRSPGFLLSAVLTLGLGIGANLAVFAIAWHAVLKPLPYSGGDRLVRLWETFGSGTTNMVMPANFRDWQREMTSLESVAAYTYFRGTSDLTGAGDPEQWEIRYVTADYFRVFGMAPLAGRVLNVSDETSESGGVVVSEAVWRQRFGADPAIVGRAIRLAGRPSVVVGVMPRAFEVGGGRVDAWGLMVLPPEDPGKRLSAHYLGVVGRLKPAVTLEQANGEIKRIAAAAALKFPVENGKLSATVESMQAARGATLRQSLAVLGAAAGVVLLVTAANLAGVQLARGLGRRRELGIRAAIGATRVRLLVQLTVESLVLALAGGLAGVLVARWTLAALSAIAQDSVRVAAGAGFDGTVLASGIGLSLVAGVLCGVIPAWRASRGAPSWTQQRMATGDAAGTVLRKLLLTSQIALSVVLAAVASLLSVSLVNVLRVDPGFRPDGLAAFDLSVPPARFETYAARATLVSGVEAAIGALPGVAGTCSINEIPFDGQNAAAMMTYVPEGQERAVAASPRNITPGCVELLGLPRLRGRVFADREPTRVALVTARFAERAWPGADPIGRRVHVGTKAGDLIEIVGVVGDSLQSSLETGSAPQLYEFASERAAFWADKVIVRTRVAPASLLMPIRAAVQRVDPDQPVARLRLVRDIVGDSVNHRRFSVALAAGFAVLTIVLTVVGAYALMAQTVSQRTAEFGVRLALGATPRALVAVVMRQAWILAAVGIAIGVAGAMLATQLLRQLVFGVSVSDPRVLAGAALVLTAVSLLAAWIPARRAARVDPIAALRVE